MPNESQSTPETDNAERALGMFSCILYGPAKRLLLQHARKLERERDAARAPSPVNAALVSALKLARDVFIIEVIKNNQAGRASAAECLLELVEEMTTALRTAKGEA